MRKLLSFTIIVTAILLCGCKAEKPQESDAEAKELLLYCGAGIRPPYFKTTS